MAIMATHGSLGCRSASLTSWTQFPCESLSGYQLDLRSAAHRGSYQPLLRAVPGVGKVPLSRPKYQRFINNNWTVRQNKPSTLVADKTIDLPHHYQLLLPTINSTNSLLHSLLFFHTGLLFSTKLKTPSFMFSPPSIL